MDKIMDVFSSKNTFDPEKDIPDLGGRVFVVTGGSSGIGLGIVSHLLAHHASKIYLLSANPAHATTALEHLKAWGDVDAVVAWRKCDLRSFEDTKEAALGIRRELEKEGGLGRLDAVVANAGVGVGVYGETGDGVDSHMQINHFSQALLIHHLLPLLLRTPRSRIVLQSSDMHRLAASDTSFTSISTLNHDIGPTRLYSRSKLAQILYVRALDRKINGEGEGREPRVYINATHPGAVNTPQQEQAVEAYGTLGAVGVALTRPFMKDAVQAGCRPALYAAVGEGILNGVDGGSFEGRGISGCYIVPDCKVTEPSAQGQDDEGLGRELWALGEQVLEGFGGQGA